MRRQEELDANSNCWHEKTIGLNLFNTTERLGFYYSRYRDWGSFIYSSDPRSFSFK